MQTPRNEDFSDHNNRWKEYCSPEIRFLRVHVIEARDLQPRDASRIPRVFVKAILGHQTLTTRVNNNNINPTWNEDLFLVVAEPFEEPLILFVEERPDPNEEDEVVGRCKISLEDVNKDMWYNLEKEEGVKMSSKIHIRMECVGGYDDLDGIIRSNWDLRPTGAAAAGAAAKQIGVLEVKFMNAIGLTPTKTRDGRATVDAYCVAKYGENWFRTRTIPDSFDPEWEESYSWNVFDLCTVVTIGVFDNCRGKDTSIGKVRIRLSNLEADRVYEHSHPLLVLHPYGMKKMGTIHLEVRFGCLSRLNAVRMYSQPVLPKMNFIIPFPFAPLGNLRHEVIRIVSMRLSRAEPPLRKEVVEYMLDVGSHMWGMRRSKANIFRIKEIFHGSIAVGKWFDQICNWKNPITTVLIHILFLILVLYRKLIPSAIFLYLFSIGVWNYRWRPRRLPQLDTRFSHADDRFGLHLDELDLDELDEEQFDDFPTSRPADIVRMRYDRLRSIAGRIETVVGDLATQGERLQSLVTWRDPRATAMFLTFCLLTVIVLCVTPFQVVVLLSGFYVLRHPRFRHKPPSVPLNFFIQFDNADDRFGLILDELDEEQFDTFPTSRPDNIVRMRYDRLRGIAGRIQTVMGDLLSQGERLQSLVTWRDPRATAIFLTFCLLTLIVLCVTPFQVVVLLSGFYVLRHPIFRHKKLESVPLNFFKRLPNDMTQLVI